MPLIYLPLIMYTGWMEFLLHPLRLGTELDASAADAALDPRP
jgi:hypothetical protein